MPTASWPARYGSSDQYSKQRPPSGLRLMLTPGPRMTATFSWIHSSAMASPTLWMSSGFQELDRPAAGGNGVVQVGFAGAGCQGFAQSVGAVGDHVAGNAFGFHTLQVPGVAAGGEGRLLFEGQVVDGRISGVAHELPLSYVFCVSGAFRLFSRPSRDCFAVGLQPRIPYLPIGRYFIKKQYATRQSSLKKKPTDRKVNDIFQ